MTPPPGERGAALLTVLLLVAVMSVITAGALERMTLGSRLAGNAAALDQARAFSFAAENIAGSRIADLIAAQGTRTTLRGNWNGTRYSLPIPGGIGTARLTDGGNCFNLNSLVTGGEREDRLGDYSVRPSAVTQFRGLMELLGVDAQAAVRIASGAADWIDSDDRPEAAGAESETYAQAPVPYRTANQLMADPSELRAVAGVTPAIYSRLRPWLCTLPVSDLSPININTLLPAQAPLLAMLIPGQLSIGKARELLAQRPADGYGSAAAFWSGPWMQGLTPMGEVGVQTVTKTKWFAVETDVELAGATVHETALYDASVTPARLVRRSWGEE